MYEEAFFNTKKLEYIKISPWGNKKGWIGLENVIYYNLKLEIISVIPKTLINLFCIEVIEIPNEFTCSEGFGLIKRGS